MSLFSRYSESGKKAIELAEQEAVALRHPYIGTEHLLLGVIAEGGEAKAILSESGITQEKAREAVAERVGDVSTGAETFDAKALEAVGIDLSVVKKKAEEAFGEGALKMAPARPRFTPRSARTLEIAVGKSASADSDLVEPLHVLQALVGDPDGFAAQIVERLAYNYADLQARLRSL